jgi:hypothetical protein
MQHASKYTLALMARSPRHQLLRNKEYLIEQFGEKAWKDLLLLNASYENKLTHGELSIRAGFTLRPPAQ